MSENKRILVYGDSNSWGYLDDGSGERFQDRWPVEMDKHLSYDLLITLIEECLPARTTNLADPELGSSFNGEATLEAVLLSHQPLDHVLIMLGTNDLKAKFDRNINDIARAIINLAEIARSTPAGRGGWFSDQTPNVSVICPLIIGQRVSDLKWDRFEEWVGAYEKSILLVDTLKRACNAVNINMIDGNQFGSSSELDPIHWNKENHQRFGQKMAKAIQAFLLD